MSEEPWSDLELAEIRLLDFSLQCVFEESANELLDLVARLIIVPLVDEQLSKAGRWREDGFFECGVFRKAEPGEQFSQIVESFLRMVLDRGEGVSVSEFDVLIAKELHRILTAAESSNSVSVSLGKQIMEASVRGGL